jgi:hypothetical protein
VSQLIAASSRFGELRGARRRWPLLFRGFASKLWMVADEQDKYRGLYEWDGAGVAEGYVGPCGGRSR